MKNVQRGIGIFFFLGASVAVGDASADHSLDITASTPTVDVSPRNPGRNYLALPTLEYNFLVNALCVDRFSTQSVSLSIADSRKSFSADQLGGNTSVVELALKVPASQLAPIVVDNFCTTSDNQPASEEFEGAEFTGPLSVTVLSALSVQAALICVSEDRQQIVYKSRPLDIALVCKPEEEVP